MAHGWTVQAATGAMMDAARRREPPLRCEAVRGRKTSALQQLRGPLHFHVSTYKATARQQQAWKTGRPLRTYRRPPPPRKARKLIVPWSWPSAEAKKGIDHHGLQDPLSGDQGSGACRLLCLEAKENGGVGCLRSPESFSHRCEELPHNGLQTVVYVYPQTCQEQGCLGPILSEAGRR